MKSIQSIKCIILHLKTLKQTTTVTGLQEVEAPRISTQSVHECARVVSPKHRPPLPCRRYPWYSFQLDAASTPGHRRPECLCQRKTSMTTTEIEHATSRLVAQFVNVVTPRYQLRKCRLLTARNKYYMNGESTKNRVTL
jgi:hypothetical protein